MAVAARHPALAMCENCPHPRAAHFPIDDQLCRVGGCPCIGFQTEAPETVEPESGPRVVQVAIPDGFAVTIKLWPIGEEPADA